MSPKYIILSFVVFVSLNLFAAEGGGYKGLGKESITAEQLKKYEPTKLSPAMETYIKSMLDIQTPGMGMLHPNKKTLYFTWKVTGITQVWKIDGPKGFPQQLTGGKDATGIVDITPDGKWLVLMRDKDGQENPGIFLQSPEGGELVTLFQKEKVQASYEFTSADSKWVYFRANDQKPDQYVIYRYHLESKSIEEIFNHPGIWAIADYKKNEKTFLMVKLTGSLSREYYEYDLATKSLTPVLGQNEKEEYAVQYARNEKDYIVQTPKFSDFRKLYLFSNGKWTEISKKIEADVESFKLDQTREHIVYDINDKGYSKLVALDAKNYKEIALPLFAEAEHVYSGTMTKDGKQMMLGVSTPNAPRTSYSFDWKTKKLTQWVIPSAPEINLNKFVKAQLEYYPAKDGTLIPMFVRRPKGCNAGTKIEGESKNCPVIVHFHGGPEAQSTPGFSPYLQLFVDQGYIFVEPNVRGSDGYGKKWLDSDNGTKRLSVITDIEDCALHIRKTWKVNGVEPKIGVMGGSYGGYSTLMAMTYFSGAYDVGVASVGMSNLLTFLENTAPYRRILRISEYGDPEKDKEALLKLSPITYVDKIKAPLMIIQGANDPRVPVGEAVQMQQTLEKKKIASNLIIFADEGHGSGKKENQVLEIGNTIEFFNKYLKQ